MTVRVVSVWVPKRHTPVLEKASWREEGSHFSESLQRDLRLEFKIIKLSLLKQIHSNQ